MATATRGIPPLAKLGIRPRLRDYVRSLWDRREFAMAIPRAQLEAQHRNTVLGGLWHLIDPMLSVLVWWIMFGVILKINRGVDNLVGFLAVGVFVFHFTANAIKSGGRALVSNEGLLRAISFPRAILPLSAVVSELMALGFAFFAMFAIVLITGEEPAWSWLMIVPLVALQLMFNAGAALTMARVGDRFRDLLQVLPYGLRVWGMLSGIFAPIENRLGDHPQLLAITEWNPGFLVMNMSRTMILENKVPESQAWIRLAIWGVVVLVGGLIFFLGKEQEYGRG